MYSPPVGLYSPKYSLVLKKQVSNIKFNLNKGSPNSSKERTLNSIGTSKQTLNELPSIVSKRQQR